MGSPAEIGFFTTDASLVIGTWDAWLVEATGVGRDAAVGRALTDVVRDLESRDLLRWFQDALTTGAVQVLAPALHHYLIACPPRVPSSRFTLMQQRVTIGPVRDNRDITGVIVAIEDVTARLEAERDLAEALASSDPDVRRQAAAVVAESERLESPQAFTPALADANWRVRAAAVRGLSHSADRNFMLSLVESIRQEHHNFSLLSSALALLAATDIDVTSPLCELLTDADADVRIQAALALGDQQNPAAVGPLLGLLHDPVENVRFQAIESLGRLHAEAAVDDLMAIVESGDFFLSFAALDALAAINDARIAPRLVPLLDNDTLRVPVADALGSLGDARAVPALVAALARSPRATESVAGALANVHRRYDQEYGDGARITDLVRQHAEPAALTHILDAVAKGGAEQLSSLVRVLGWFEGENVERMLTRLLGEPSVRNDVIEALLRHGEGVVELLIEQLRSEDRDTRHAAIVALGRLGSRRATAALIDMLDDDAELLVATTGALARIGDNAAFDPLMELLGHSDAAVRQSAIGALNSIGHPDLPTRIVALLSDDDPIVRESAVRIAGYFGYPETIDRLFELARDDDETVRRAALEHLPFLDDRRVTPTLLHAIATDTPRARAAATRAIARVNEPAAHAALCDALSDDDAWVRYFAARGIAEVSHSGALDVLVERAQKDPAAHVRIAAVDAMGSIGGEQLVPVLKALTGDPHDEVSAAALGALGRVAAAEGLPELQQAARATDPGRRIAAIRALSTQGGVEAVTSLEWAAAADPDPTVAAAAVDGLAGVASGHAAGALAALDALIAMLNDRGRRDAACVALARLPESRIPDVARGLEHPHPEVRRGTVEALGRSHHEVATRLVSHALKDSAAAVREAALVALVRVGARGMNHAYAELASHDPSKSVRRAAATALAHSRA